MLLTAAVTVLGLSGTPALPGGPYDRSAASSGRTYSTTYTRLAASVPGSPYGSFAGKDTGSGASRTYGGTYTRLSLRGTPMRLYGEFTGKTETTTADKYSTHSILPRVTIGDVTEVDVYFTHWLVPRVTQTAVISRNLASNHSLIPRVTLARGQVASSSFNKASSHSLIPKVTQASSHLSKDWFVDHSLIPVVTMESTVETSYDEILSDHSLIPVVTLSSSVNSILQAKASSHSLIPVVTLTNQVQRYNAVVQWEVAHVLIPRVRMSVTARASGDVDHIEITARPFGYIEITKA